MCKPKIYYNSALTKLAKDLRNHMTNAEKIVWQAFKSKQFLDYDFHRQKPMGDYIVDFYCYELKLVIEIDGITHADESVQIKDKAKDKYIRSVGFEILRFTDDEILGNWDKVEKSILSFISMNSKKCE